MSLDAERSFVQLMLSECLMTREKVDRELIRLSNTYKLNRPLHLEDARSRMNKRLLPLDLELQSRISENDGIEYWSIINTRDDEISKKLSHLPSKSIRYFRSVLRELLSHGGRLPYSKAVQIRSKLGNSVVLSDSDARSILSRFTREGWISHDPIDEEILCIGVRSHMELKQYFENLNDAAIASTCYLCQELCIRGLMCSQPNGNQECENSRIHIHCANRMFPDGRMICRFCNVAAIQEMRFEDFEQVIEEESIVSESEDPVEHNSEQES